MPSAARAAFLALWAAVPWLAAFSPATHANMGKPWSDGDPAAEPVGFGRTRVDEERLWLDFTGLDADSEGKVAIQALYTLRHDGPDAVLRPLFVTGAQEVGDFRAYLDERPLPVRLRRVAVETLPASWRTQIDGQPSSPLQGTPPYDVIGNADGKVAVAEIELPIARGTSAVRIVYQARPMVRLHGEGPTLAYQFEYALAPARTWAAFGRLIAEVKVPHGWTARLSPPMARIDADASDGDSSRGEVYRLESAGLPADALAVIAQARPGIPYRVAMWGSWLVFLAAIWAGWKASRLWARASLRRVGAGKSSRIGVHAACAGLAWGLGLAYAGFVAHQMPPMLLPEGQRAVVRMDLAPFLIAVLSIACVPLGAWRVWRAYRRGSRAPAS
ncbi:hypothetical protein [Luteimonas aquatica]|uniref:hypothetical protein n=1 Tax=Luteimonas aquatica TaxID=450364 RepID=UPI001F56A85A|nr:hypothetical protein [Luteimonas aquatica]